MLQIASWTDPGGKESREDSGQQLVSNWGPQSNKCKELNSASNYLNLKEEQSPVKP